jgi:NAD(P)-dependent dehydrogenase (short-subunit alcohol dehydrogenase family)
MATLYELDGKRAVVTGAGRGIGRAVALTLAELGCDIAVMDIDLTSGRQVPREATDPTVEAVLALGRRALGIEADLTVEDSAAESIAKVVDASGGFDILVNIAGGAVSPFERSSPSTIPAADIARLFDVNLMSAVYMCRAAVPVLRKSDTPAIINTTSLSALGILPGGKLSGYAMSKGALGYYTRTLAEEVGPEGIRVNSVSPGHRMTGRIKANSVARVSLARPKTAPSAAWVIRRTLRTLSRSWLRPGPPISPGMIWQSTGPHDSPRS